MSKRISWKKGMRLTDEILSMSDNCTSELIGKALVLSAGGNFGLFPNSRPFSISLDINRNVIDVVSLNCIGITRDGTLVDVQYDTNYTNSFDTRTSLPNYSEDATYILCISSTGEWRDTNDGLCEPVYSFNVFDENSSVPANTLPIARIVHDEYCWRMDDIDFVPPCLFISSHDKYVELYSEFKQLLGKFDTILPHKFVTESKDALKIFWPIVQQMVITVDKERDFMTPMMLLGSVQRLVSGFVMASELDDYITLGNQEEFKNYLRGPYNIKNVYAEIMRGMKLTETIYAKIEVFENVKLEPVVSEGPKITTVEAPTISKKQLEQSVDCGPVTIRVSNSTPGATVYYTTDGSTPSQMSDSGETITVESGFRPDWHKEPPVQFTIKLIAIKGGRSSSVATYKIKVWKFKIPEI